MRAADIIIKKRGTSTTKAQALTKEEIKFMVEGYVKGEIPDYQMSALMMAIYFSGMTFEETGYLTQIMLHSGDVIDLHAEKKRFPNLTGPFVDKHSTGGVGDKLSLTLAPLVASCGVQVPMMSGRGLGHTGGTLDKLESIPGYTVGLTKEKFAELISQNGYAMTGQTKEIVPADRLMYALRDVTGTVESIPLITASILSKKVAEGSDALVFDVKCGSGAFMKTEKDAEALATSLVETAKTMGKKCNALITAMSTPLGNKIGNYLEIEEALEFLQNKGPSDIREVTLALAVPMILFSEKTSSKEEARKMCEEAISSGKALEAFLTNIKSQGGDPEKLLAEQGKRRSPYKETLLAERDGYLSIEAYQTGISCINLGVGRNKTSDKVDADSGIILLQRQGDFVKKGQPIMEVYGKSQNALDSGLVVLKKAVSYSDTKLPEQKLIIKEIN